MLECPFAIFLVDKKVQMFLKKDRFSFISPIIGFISALITKNIFDELNYTYLAINSNYIHIHSRGLFTRGDSLIK